jgi:UDP-N-acetyl-D-galactosamine dehydrogenase
VDPYYLTHKAQSIGHHSEIILTGWRLNDSMGVYVISQFIKSMMKRRIKVEGTKVLVMASSSRKTAPTCAIPAW